MEAGHPLDHSRLKPISLSSDINLSDFDCGDADLNDFIKNNALDYQRQDIAQTTCVLYGDKVIAFYTLACDSLSLLKNEKRKEIPYPKRIYDNFPAVKICRMACVKDYQKKGVGSLLVNIILGMVWDLNKEGIGCRFITVDAYPERVTFYQKNGFKFNLAENITDNKRTMSMRLNIFKQNDN